MPGNQYNGNSTPYPSRTQRLLRERELKKSSRASHSNEVTDNHGGTEPCEHDLRLRERDNSNNSYIDQYLEVAATRQLAEGCEKQDGRPLRQRLLVVANRLPVSAVRRGEDSWSLEISAGGLVSALLGKCLKSFFLSFFLFFFLTTLVQYSPR